MWNYFKKGRGPIKFKKYFNVRIHGEIRIEVDVAAQLRKHSIVQTVGK